MAKGIVLFLLGSLVVIVSNVTNACAVVRTRPQQVHLSANSSHQMIVVWSTMDDTNDTRVLYGKTRNLTHQATGGRQELVNGLIFTRSQFIHKVVVSGLEPDTKYFYVAGSKKYGYSDLFSFKTWPAGDSWAPSLAIYGDLGNENAQSLPRIQVDADKGMYHAILHIGDFAYDMHTDEGRVGDEFMRQIEPVAATLPYMTCPGNHEYAYNFSNYRHRFWMPGDENKQMFYSFTMGPIRFISLDTEAIFCAIIYGYEPVVKQYKWLEQELKKVNLPENRAKQPWVITLGHRPMYCSNMFGDLCLLLANPIRVGIPALGIPGWEKLFYDNGVDVAFSAHEHSYERMWPVYDQKVMNGSMEHPYTNPKAPVHIVTGSAGCQERISKFADTFSDWSAVHSTDYGYTRMKVFNSTHLHIEQVSDDQGGAIVDAIWVIKDKHGSFGN